MEWLMIPGAMIFIVPMVISNVRLQHFVQLVELARELNDRLIETGIASEFEKGPDETGPYIKFAAPSPAGRTVKVKLTWQGDQVALTVEVTEPNGVFTPPLVALVPAAPKRLGFRRVPEAVSVQATLAQVAHKYQLGQRRLIAEEFIAGLSDWISEQFEPLGVVSGMNAEGPFLNVELPGCTHTFKSGPMLERWHSVSIGSVGSYTRHSSFTRPPTTSRMTYEISIRLWIQGVLRQPAPSVTGN